MDNILIIDGMNQIYRANVVFGKPVKHELNPETNKCLCGLTWKDTYCYSKYANIYSFFRNIRANLEQFKPKKCFIAFEGHPQFRYDLYPEYKANRLIKTAAKKDTYDLVMENANHIKRILSHLPITQVSSPKYEADDVIGTLCDDLKEEKVTVLSNDSDFTQLLQKDYKNLTIYNPIKKENMTAPAYPYVAWKALAGDTSDNIKKLSTSKKIEKMMSDPEEFKKFMELEENKCNFIINRDLIQIRHIPPEDLVIKEGNMNPEAVFAEFQQFEMASYADPHTWNKFISTFNCIEY